MPVPENNFNPLLSSRIKESLANALPVSVKKPFTFNMFPATTIYGSHSNIEFILPEKEK